MRKIFWATVSAAALGLVIGGVSWGSGGPANSGNPMVIKLISRATAINNFVDTGPPGFGPGDLYVFSDRLFLADSRTDQIGRDDGRCVLIDPAALRFDCSVTAHIPEGEPLDAGDIMSAGTLTLVQGTTSTFAIVGGTGPYRTARGDVSIKLGPLEGPHEVTVNLILNP
jgi:allene oxide cyclase-like protein